MRKTLLKKGLFALFFAAMLGSISSSFAQTFSIVGSGTTSSGINNWNPYHNGYWGQRSQFFLTAAQISAAGVSASGLINSVGFNIVQAGTGNAATLEGFTITVRTTTAANPITAWLTTGQVAQSTPTTLNVGATGWNQVSLGAGFIWNGTDNLVIETCFNKNSWVNTYARVQCTTSGLGTATWSRWFRADAAGVCANTGQTNTNITSRPNIRLGWTSSVACSGTPNAGTAAINSASGCSGQPLTLSATGLTTDNGISYQWQSAPTSTGAWTDILGATAATSNTTSVAGQTFYRLVSTCSNGGFSNNTTNNISFNNTGGAACGGICPTVISAVPVVNQAIACNSTAMPGALNATNVPTACGGASNSYKGGQDALYTFTPTVSGTYNISINGQTYSAIFVYSGACPANGGVCVASIGDANSAKSLDVNLVSGTLYFIWFDTWPAPNSPCPGTFSISAPCTAPAVVGSGTNTWNILGYNGRDVNLGGATSYQGHYNASALSYNTTAHWAEGTSPTAAAGYVGCPTNNDNHTVVAKRTGVPTPGIYQINVNNHDDEYQLLVNGNKIMESSYCCAPHIGVHSGFYDASTTFEMRHADAIGSSSHQISITPQDLDANVAVLSPLSCVTPLGSLNFTNATGAIEAPIFRSTFENATGLTLHGNASVTGGALQLTPNTTSQFGTAILPNLANYNASSFRAEFDFRIFDGSGADGLSFNYAPNYAGSEVYSNAENGIGSGLTVSFVTFPDAGGPSVRVRYNGVNVGAAVSVTLRNNLYRQCVVTVNNNNQITVSVAGVIVINNLDLPSAFKTTDKTNWQFAFASRTGGVSDAHRLDNVFINVTNMYEYSIDNGSTWSANPLFENLAVGTYTPAIRNSLFPAYPETLPNVNISSPALSNPNAGSDVFVCSGGSAQLNGSATGPVNLIAGSTSATLTTGSISSEFIATPTTANNSACPGDLSVTIPVGAQITGVNVNYSFTAAGGGYISEQRSYLQCISTGGTKEAAIVAGPVINTGGTQTYSRTNLTIANGVTGGGTINFRLHAFRNWEGVAGCNTSINAIDNNTLVITVNYLFNGAALTYSWSPTDGLSNPNIANPIANPTTTTTYTMTVTLNDCPTVSDEMTFTINPSTLSGTLSACVGSTSDLSVPGESDWTVFPTGGTVTNIGNNEKIHVFTTSGTFNTPVALNGSTVMVIGGGGGGGNQRGGGGGAGGLILNTNVNIPSGNSTATVGAGGGASTAGANSSFVGLTAIGGGRGGSHLATDAGGNGGSGGGAAMNYNTNIFQGGTATAGQGFNGASSGNQGTDNPRNTGGGGGAGQAGTIGAGGNATWTTGTKPKGGDGLLISQFSTVGGSPAGWYAAGGGGARGGADSQGAGAGLGGQGGGGNGSDLTVAATAGLANTGSGGGGGELGQNGANGGSGVVMIRYFQPTWVSSNPAVATVNASTGLVTAVSPGTSMITYYSQSGCVYQSEFTVGALSVAPTSINNLQTLCNGGTTQLQQVGGTLGSGAQWEWFNGSCGGTAVATGETVTVAPTANTNYFVRASAIPGCPASSCASLPVNLPTAGTNLSLDGQNATCYVNHNNWVHFYNASGRLIASIKSNNQNLGSVVVTSHIANDPYESVACDDPTNESFFQASLQRTFVITPENQPTTPVQVRLYLLDNEIVAYINAAQATIQNPNDDINGLSDLNMSKVSSGVLGGNPENLCSAGGTVSYVQKDAFGSINNLAGFNGFSGASYLEFTIDGFSEFFPMKTDGSPLPVTLTNFSANCMDDKVRVNWRTASELNASHYVLQSSRDGQTWLKIAEIPAAGTTNQASNYGVDDINTGALTYYRLVQVDLDGAQEIFGPISSNCTLDESSLSVYPNPTNDNFTVYIQSNESFTGAVVELTDMSGRVLTSQTTNLNAGSTMLNFEAKALHAGTYMVRVKGQNDKFTPIRVVRM